MSDIYRVTLADDRNISYVEADSKPEARKVALAGVTVEKLNGSEVRALLADGKDIISAKTGKVIGAEDAASGDDHGTFDPGA